MKRMIVLMVAPELQVQAVGRSVISVANADVSSLADALAAFDADIKPLFGETEERLRMRAASALKADTPFAAPALDVFYEVSVEEAVLAEVLERLNALPGVDGAYAQPVAVPAGKALLRDINLQTPSTEPAPPATPSFLTRQGYLGAAPAGINAAYAWSKAGGRGDGIRIIDCEGAWRFTHEDLRQNQGGVIGSSTDDLGWRNHGTAVVSVIGGDDNGFGVMGIAPNSLVRGSSIFGQGGLPGALRAATDALRPGDLILIEVQYGHPTKGYTSVEWWPAEHAAIRYAVGKGIIVVEAAGNGGNDLDDPIYDLPLDGFPGSWRNPFRRNQADSGAVLVGAGSPPPGTHGRNHGPDRSRLSFSNYGAAIDAQGWGREVTSAGYGDLQGGSNEDLWYSDEFSGTSSASPIVVGALACVQGALLVANRPLLTPASARELLRATGSYQVDGPDAPVSQRIGNRPDLRQMLDRALDSRITSAPLYRYWNSTIADHFYTTDWAELGNGNHGWNYEGIQCYIFPTQVAGYVPLYRYWNGDIGDHFYTTNWAELGGGSHGWAYEGIQGYVLPQSNIGSVPLYRYWNSEVGDHFYTTNWAELGGGSQGWAYEGIQCYVYPTAFVPEEYEAPQFSAAAMLTFKRQTAAFGPAPTEGAIPKTDFAEKTAAVRRVAAKPLGFAEKSAAQARNRAPAPSAEAMPLIDDPAIRPRSEDLQVRTAAGVTFNIYVNRG